MLSGIGGDGIGATNWAGWAIPMADYPAHWRAVGIVARFIPHSCEWRGQAVTTTSDKVPKPRVAGSARKYWLAVCWFYDRVMAGILAFLLKSLAHLVDYFTRGAFRGSFISRSG